MARDHLVLRLVALGCVFGLGLTTAQNQEVFDLDDECGGESMDYV